MKCRSVDCFLKLCMCLFFGLCLIISPAITAQMTSPYHLIRTHAQTEETKPCPDSTYDLLIITPEEFSETLCPLVTHKERVGIRTTLVTVEEVYHQMFWQGRDDAEKIKYFIKNAEEHWGITYVLLVGDFQRIPIRYCFNADNNSFWNEPFFISELYFADLYDSHGNFSSWDTNNNGRYGEWFTETAEDADIDLYPDVYVGRLACRNNAEVRDIVQKIIDYETHTYGNAWFNTIVVVAGDTYPESENPNWTGNEGEENSLRVLENMTGFEATKLWTSDGSLSGPKDVIRAINKGCGFLFFEGHANAFEWSTHPSNDVNTWIKGLDTIKMNRLRNTHMYPVCIVGGCHNNEFDVTPKNIIKGIQQEGLRYFSSRAVPFGSFWKFTWISECWGWKLARMSTAGSIATIGCTGLGMSKEDKQSFSGAGDYMDPMFFYEYGKNGTTILGKAWGNAITNYLQTYPIDWQTPTAQDYAIDAKTVQQWALLGDPSLKIGGYPLSDGKETR